MQDVRLILLQRITAMLDGPAGASATSVIMVYAIQGGLTAAEILSRTRAVSFWGLFYGLFVLAVAIHAAIGLRVVVHETVGLSGSRLDWFTRLVALIVPGHGWPCGLCGGAVMIKPHRKQPLWLAYMLHRVSGVALALFLPLHFYLLGFALTDSAALDAALHWTDNPLAKIAEFGLVFLFERPSVRRTAPAGAGVAAVAAGQKTFAARRRRIRVPRAPLAFC